MRAAFCCRTATAIALVLAAWTPVQAADGSIDEAKALYAAASFDNALAVISALAVDATNAPEVREY
jgi:hypothetical protein